MNFIHIHILLESMKNSQKAIRTLLLLSCLQFVLSAKAQEHKPLKRDLYLDVGFKYIPIDFIGGPVFGLSYHSPDKKLSFNLRYDVAFSIGKKTQAIVFPDSISYIAIDDHFSLENFQVRTYLESEYLVWQKTHKKLSAGVGLGWIYLGDYSKLILNEESGYYCLSLSLKYKWSWFYIEPRIDVPIKTNSRIHDYNFPGSIALIYRFKPKANE